MKGNTLLFCVVLWLCGRNALAQSATLLKLVQTIPMPNVEGRIDHMAADMEHQRLFVAALSNNTVEIVDLRAGKVTQTLKGLHEPQGIAYLPEFNRFFVANGESGACDIFDGGTYQRLSTLNLGDDADNVRYDAVTKSVYVGYGRGGLSILTAPGGKSQGSVRLSGHPESFQLEANGPRIFVNVPSANHIAVVDRQQKKVLATWPLVGAQSNFPMALDEANHRLFIGCRNPAKVLVYDTTTGKVVASMDIVGDTDDLFYDATHKRLYVSGGAGAIEVFHQKDADHYTSLAHLTTADGARTSLFAPKLGRLYLAVPHRGNQPAEIRVFEVE